MPGIELPPLVGQNAPAVAGDIISGFGQDVINVGNALANRANYEAQKAGQQQIQYNAQQQALLDAEEAKQIIAAKAFSYSSIDTFNQGLDSNLDYTKYGDMWNEQKTAMQEQLSSILTLPSAKQKFDEWWVPQQDKQVQYVYGQTRQKTVAAAQATFTTSIDQLAKDGNEQGILDIAKQGAAAGIYSASEAAAIAKDKIPLAHFNQVFNYLDKNANEVDVLDELSQTGATEKWNLSPDQLAAMIGRFTDKLTAQTRVDAERKKAGQEQIFTQLLKDSSDPQTMPTRERVTKDMIALVGSPYYGQAEQLRNSIDAEGARIMAARADYGETKIYSSFQTSMLMWSGSGKAPWDPTTINEAVTNPDANLRITKEDGNKLNSLYEQTMKDINSGTRKGPNFEDPNKVADMYRIVFADGPSVTDKVTGVQPFFANGVPPAKWAQIRGMIDEYNNREDWKTAMRPLTAYYSAAISDPANADNRQKLSLEQGAASEAMIAVFRQYPNDPAMWKQASDSIMDKNVLPKLINQVQSQLKASFPSVAWAFGKISQSTQLETMRELAPTQFARSPGLVAQASMQANQIANEEKDVLSKAGVNTIDSYRDPKTGAWFYSTVPIPRDAKGNVDLVALAKAGNLYQVQEQTAGGKFTRTPVKVGIK
jgi:hypothetical protein